MRHTQGTGRAPDSWGQPCWNTLLAVTSTEIELSSDKTTSQLTVRPEAGVKGGKVRGMGGRAKGTEEGKAPKWVGHRR